MIEFYMDAVTLAVKRVRVDLHGRSLQCQRENRNLGTADPRQHDTLR